MRMNHFARYAWGVLGYNLLIILWGALVRATGSGAGCGSHWPLCNGEVVPRAPEVETIIELTHRLTSAFAGLLVLAMFIWAWRAYPRGHRVRKGAALSLVFIIIEGLIGAALVLFEWVAYDASWGRVISISLHLNNTFILVAVLTLTAWWASGGDSFRFRSDPALGWLLGVGLVSLLVVCTAGAITALGDTLFQVDSLAEGLQRDFSSTSHVLERLRIWHPILALFAGGYLILVARRVMHHQPGPTIRRLGWSLQGLLLVQLFLGVINVLMLAPVALQLIHLLVADAIWIAMVLLTAAALATPVSHVQTT